MELLTKKQIYRISFFLLFVVVFVALMNLITPFLFRMLPNDYARTRLIVKTIDKTLPEPDVVIFGNSRGMSGIDGYMLEEKLKDHPVVYSLTTTGQLLGESMLYYHSLPSSVKTVIQCVDLDVLSKSVNINIPNLVALYMYGYRMNDETQKFIPELIKDFSHSDWYYNFEARKCVFAGFSVILRDLLDDDAPESSIETELRYPVSHRSDRNEITYQPGIEEQIKQNKFASYRITPEWERLLTSSYTYFKSKGINYCIVLLPYNPDIISTKKTEKLEAIQSFREVFKDIPYVDCVNLLEASDFFDATHSNDKGAKKITNQLLISLP